MNPVTPPDKYPEHLSDRLLRERFRKSGNKIYVGELYRRYVHLVLGVCYKYLHNNEEACDATMEIFESLYEKLHHHEIKSFKSWLYIVSRNHCLQQLRQQKKMTMVSLKEEYISTAFMENNAFQHHDIEQEELLSALPGMLNALTPGQQQCLSYFYFDNHTYEEISLKTDFSIKQVKSHLQNGKRKLKLLLETKFKHLEP
ncbi:MAG: sigma-70 family RNA polymerase sigma factor [Lentimicrobium sp.]|mgnify:CR=1 FL=1|jgi:RNA polymerase sigma-70 factor (ECF subfamily)|nr:sigma-70 family RNA polymerase sigma factor [Lentimicrobium sp.]MDD2528807.1 sigma-70 family RNA polymerase sigma factor [Lentimicrobiaceae bacterium]MDD4598367.1 sigma-70 family RNA polymerase sigma factor [Lentimicrobiaceae bacterium]MDY0025604.1 sigma-70 family RNA polymerase sigma factor [Lentimicrobium sp.]HAH59500.1 RNA polymerase subunit sigma-70 [Bacteroidales bacterium]